MYELVVNKKDGITERYRGIGGDNGDHEYANRVVAFFEDHRDSSWRSLWFHYNGPDGLRKSKHEVFIPCRDVESVHTVKLH
jgi:hypothetical protein